MNGQGGWRFILAGGAAEVVWAVALDRTEGFGNVFWTAVFVIGLAVSMYLLSKGIASGLPVGAAYAVWVGIGASGVFVVGMLFLGEPVGFLRIAFMTMIVAGAVGLRSACPGAVGLRSACVREK